MDDGDVSLAVRRARRSGAKSLDLSQRALRAWPEGLFALRHLESLDLSGNELTAVDNSGLKQLELLEELNLADNRLDALPEIDIRLLPRLRSLHLEGNPVASRLPSSTIRELAHPPRRPGQSPAQVLAALLQERAAPADVGVPTTILEQDQEQEQELGPGLVSPAEDCGPEALPERRSGGLRVARPLGSAGAAAAVVLDGGGLPEELARLRARVAELEAAAGSQAPAPPKPTPTPASSLPAWLQEEPKHSRLSQTLPSRQRGLVDSDEASEAKEQLRDEQRRSKRLEKEVQKLSERLNERHMTMGGVGSVPHFDFSEVELGDIMAQGGFSVVHRGHWHTTKIACKKLFDPNINEELLAEFDNEVQKLEQIRHPNILMLLAVHRKPPALAMITELVEGGSFYQLLHTPSKFNFSSASIPSAAVSPGQSLQIMDYAGTALAFLHARGIAHRDVKSQNVLLSPTLEVKLCDFGLARMKSELMTGAMQFAGTPNYMAPEIFRNQKYTETVDVFAYGTMLWEALVMDIPFANLDPADIREKVLAGQMPSMSSAVPSAAQSLIKACWVLDRERRPPMAEAVRRLRTLTPSRGGVAA